MPPEEHRAPEVWDWLFEIAIATAAFLIVLSLLGFYIVLGYDWYEIVLGRLGAVWQAVRVAVMVITILLSIGLVGFATVILHRFFALSPSLPVRARPGTGGAIALKSVPLGKGVSDEWQEVKKLLESDSPSDWSMAVIRADALLDDVLQYLRYEGTTVKERLDRVDPTMVLSLERLYSAHRLRNVIAHDPTVQYDKATIAYALRSFEQGLRELGVLKEEKYT